LLSFAAKTGLSTALSTKPDLKVYVLHKSNYLLTKFKFENTTSMVILP